MINYDSLPKNNPAGLVPAGTYVATVDKAYMKTPKPKDDGSVGKDYLNLELTLNQPDGGYVGKFFDKIFDSEHEYARFKLGRFIEANEIPIQGNFELKDLSKVITPGKKFIVDVSIDERGKTPQSVVDIFSGQCYYPMSDASRIFGNSLGLTGAEEEISAPDAFASVGVSAHAPNGSVEEY